MGARLHSTEGDALVEALEGRAGTCSSCPGLSWGALTTGMSLPSGWFQTSLPSPGAWATLGWEFPKGWSPGSSTPHCEGGGIFSPSPPLLHWSASWALGSHLWDRGGWPVVISVSADCRPGHSCSFQSSECLTSKELSWL